MRGPDYWTTDDANPRRLCHDVLVAIDETRRLNIGQPAGRPSSTSLPLSRLSARSCWRGLVYFSALLATLVGSSGAVTAIAFR